MPILELKDVNKTYQNGPEMLSILKNVSLKVNVGEIAIITGESGSGKSTLLNLIGGLDEADSGSIKVHDREIIGLDEYSLGDHRRNRIGFIFQFHHLLKDFTALENIMLPRYMAGADRKKALELAATWLESVGLKKRGQHFPSQLSGGERQRVALARALMNDPSLILADEPTGNLDEKNSRMVEDLLFDLVKEHGKTLILVTHDTLFRERGTVGFHLVGGEVHHQ